MVPRQWKNTWMAGHFTTQNNKKSL
jgi:hypothetical protein